MKRYLVTGAAGFIGANFVKHLLSQYGNEIDITIVDALTYAGNLKSIADELTLPNVHFERGDIGDTTLIDRLLREHDIDYVVNFAAESHVDRSITQPRLFLETNILGTQNLLECVRRCWQTGRDSEGRPAYAEGKKYLQISTDEVYGSLSKDFDSPRALHVDEALRRVIGDRTDLVTYGQTLFTEETPVSPRSPSSASKTGADLITLAYHETYGLPVNITRCSNNYGPYHFPEKLIPLIIRNVLSGNPLPVYGQGVNVRDWLYVEDHCRAIDLVLRRGRVGEVYNVGGFNEQRNIDIVRSIIAIIARIMRDEPMYRQYLKCRLEDINDGLITYVTDRPGHDMRYAIDPSKIASELGWYPKTPFSTGLEKTIRWNLDHQDWVESVTSNDYQQYYEQMYGNR